MIKRHCKRCPRCGDHLKTVYVHGHEQCVTCDSVIDDCCQGEVCQQKTPQAKAQGVVREEGAMVRKE